MPQVMLPETVIQALLIVRAGGEFGVTLPEFAAKWPSTLPPGQARKTLRGVSTVTSSLVTQGLVRRSSPSQRARFTITAAGERWLAQMAAEARSGR